MTLCYHLVKKFGANISNFCGFRGFTILSGFNSQLQVYGDDLAVDPSKIFFSHGLQNSCTKFGTFIQSFRILPKIGANLPH